MLWPLWLGRFRWCNLMYVRYVRRCLVRATYLSASVVALFTSGRYNKCLTFDLYLASTWWVTVLSRRRNQSQPPTRLTFIPVRLAFVCVLVNDASAVITRNWRRQVAAYIQQSRRDIYDILTAFSALDSVTFKSALEISSYSKQNLRVSILHGSVV